MIKKITKVTYENDYSSDPVIGESFEIEQNAIDVEKFYDSIKSHLVKVDNGTAEFRLSEINKDKEYFTGAFDVNGTKIYVCDILEIPWSNRSPSKVWIWGKRTNWWWLLYDRYGREPAIKFRHVMRGKVVGRIRDKFRRTQDDSRIQEDSGNFNNMMNASSMAFTSQCMMNAAISCM